MIREQIIQTRDHDPHFAWRTTEVLRIENLSDIVFALALGILVSASSTIRTFADLAGYLVSIIPIAAGFAMLVSIWNDHFLFFRRYALADGRIILLNAVLLLLILYIAYPLRFVFDSLFGFLLLQAGQMDRIIDMQVGFRESGIIMSFFAGGFGAIYVVFALMYARALKLADQLGLTPNEKQMTRRTLYVHIARITAATLVFAGAMLTPLNGFAGFGLVLIWPFAQIAVRLTPAPGASASPAAND
ncbi:MAG: TMEM175 family protein [Hyphomonas sp.]